MFAKLTFEDQGERCPSPPCPCAGEKSVEKALEVSLHFISEQTDEIDSRSYWLCDHYIYITVLIDSQAQSNCCGQRLRYTYRIAGVDGLLWYKELTFAEDDHSCCAMARCCQGSQQRL